MTDPTGKGGDVTDASNAPQADKLESTDALAYDLAEEWISPEPAAEPAGS